jgi:hypothetical protein
MAGVKANRRVRLGKVVPFRGMVSYGVLVYDRRSHTGYP